MTLANQPELFWLTATALLTTLLFVPYVLARVGRIGLVAATGTQPDPDPRQGWSWRAARAHVNSIDNLVVFAPLVLVLMHLDAGSSMTATACAVYFFARVVHYIVYLAGIPVVRTLAFAVGVGCQVALALRIFGVL